MQGYTNTKRELSCTSTSESSNWINIVCIAILTVCIYIFLEKPKLTAPSSIVLSSDGGDPIEVSMEDIIGMITYMANENMCMYYSMCS